MTPAGLLPILFDFTWPYSYQLNFTVQREVARGLSVSAGYVGTLSHGLAFSPDINYPIFTSTATSSNYNKRRPILPGVLSSINLMQSNQTASYNSLQVSAKKSMSRDLSLSVFYTFSKSLSSAEMTGRARVAGRRTSIT